MPTGAKPTPVNLLRGLGEAAQLFRGGRRPGQMCFINTLAAAGWRRELGAGGNEKRDGKGTEERSPLTGKEVKAPDTRWKQRVRGASRGIGGDG